MVPVSGGSVPAAPQGCSNRVSIKALLFVQAAEQCGLCRQPRAATHSAPGWGIWCCCARGSGAPLELPSPQLGSVAMGRVWRCLGVCTPSNTAKSSAGQDFGVFSCALHNFLQFLAVDQRHGSGGADSPGSPHEHNGC